MRRMLAILLTLLMLPGMARAEETTMSVMDTILSFKQEIPGAPPARMYWKGP